MTAAAGTVTVCCPLKACRYTRQMRPTRSGRPVDAVLIEAAVRYHLADDHPIAQVAGELQRLARQISVTEQKLGIARAHSRELAAALERTAVAGEALLCRTAGADAARAAGLRHELSEALLDAFALLRGR